MAYTSFQGKKIYYTTQGNGPVVVLLHGFLESSNMWPPVMDAFKHCQVVTIDLPGHGKTETFGSIHSMALMARCVKAVVDELKINAFSIVGHSMGGYVALEFASIFQQQLNGLCLLHSTANSDSPNKQKDRDRAAKVLQLNASVFIREAIPNLFAPENRVKYHAACTELKKEALKVSIEGAQACLMGMKERKDHCALIEQFKHPVWYILGDKDPVLPIEKMQQQLQKNVHTVILKNVGHMGFIEAQEDVLNALKAYVTACKLAYFK